MFRTIFRTIFTAMAILGMKPTSQPSRLCLLISRTHIWGSQNLWMFLNSDTLEIQREAQSFKYLLSFLNRNAPGKMCERHTLEEFIPWRSLKISNLSYWSTFLKSYSHSGAKSGWLGGMRLGFSGRVDATWEKAQKKAKDSGQKWKDALCQKRKEISIIWHTGKKWKSAQKRKEKKMKDVIKEEIPIKKRCQKNQGPGWTVSIKDQDLG